MNNQIKNLIIVASIGMFWFGLSVMAWVNTPQESSESERRKLEQLPLLEYKTFLSGEYMKDFEEYTKDQFPNRFGFRTIKAYTRFYLLQQKDNNKIYIEDDFAAKLEYPLNENSIKTANNRFRYLYEKYMKASEGKIFLSVIPDKGYYLGTDKGYPSMNYERLFDLIKEGNDYAKYIDITEVLSKEDYYKTDIHWKQEMLDKVAEKLGAEMGIADALSLDFEIIDTGIPFYGVYYGQSALPLKPDQIKYLTNDVVRQCIVYNIETNTKAPVYDIEGLKGRDPYDVYLSGATPLLIIDNPNAKTDKELIVFRDSFGSSLIPLLLEGYSKVTLVDIRYISSDMLGNYITFQDQDVLFLYSTSILNSSTMLK